MESQTLSTVENFTSFDHLDILCLTSRSLYLDGRTDEELEDGGFEDAFFITLLLLLPVACFKLLCAAIMTDRTDLLLISSLPLLPVTPDIKDRN